MSSTKVLATVVNKVVASEVEAQVKTGRYLNESDFLRSAIRAELDRIKDKVEAPA